MGYLDPTEYVLRLGHGDDRRLGDDGICLDRSALPQAEPSGHAVCGADAADGGLADSAVELSSTDSTGLGDLAAGCRAGPLWATAARRDAGPDAGPGGMGVQYPGQLERARPNQRGLSIRQPES